MTIFDYNFVWNNVLGTKNSFICINQIFIDIVMEYYDMKINKALLTEAFLVGAK